MGLRREVKNRHGAIIKISLKILEDFLDFKGATIHRVYTDDGWIDPTYFNVVIEHPDLPLLKSGEMLKEITPVMQFYYGENGVLLKIERIDPPKGIKHKEKAVNREVLRNRR